LYDIDNGEEPLGTTVHLAEILLQTIPLSHLRIGTTIFRRTVPRSRESLRLSKKLDADSLFSSFNSTLINGKGRYPGGPDVPLAVVNVQQGKRSA
jgi:hypothetical protein